MKCSITQNFSEVMHGAPLLYNLVLAEQGRRKEGVAKISPKLQRVGKIDVRARPRFGAVGQKTFWEIVRSVDPGITAPTHEFINSWWDSALAGNAERGQHLLELLRPPAGSRLDIAVRRDTFIRPPQRAHAPTFVRVLCVACYDYYLTQRFLGMFLRLLLVA